MKKSAPQPATRKTPRGGMKIVMRIKSSVLIIFATGFCFALW